MDELTTSTPTQDERTFACLAHLLQFVGWFIGPLVILVLKRESRFVVFHAVQALLWQITYAVVMGVLVVSLLVMMFALSPDSDRPRTSSGSTEEASAGCATGSDRNAAECTEGPPAQSASKTASRRDARPARAFFLIFIIAWGGGMGAWVLTLILSIVYGIKAMNGQWAAYPLLGRLAHRLTGTVAAMGR